jgi:hypothetical protein
MAGPSASAFLRHVKTKLGDRAVIHVANILPPHVRENVVANCDTFICVNGVHWSVKDRRKFVTNLRKAAEGEGIITTFFEWTGFRLVFFVESEMFDLDGTSSVISSEKFMHQFGDFDLSRAIVMHARE